MNILMTNKAIECMSRHMDMFPFVAFQLISHFSVDKREKRLRLFCAIHLRMDTAAYLHLPINRDQFIP